MRVTRRQAIRAGIGTVAALGVGGISYVGWREFAADIEGRDFIKMGDVQPAPPKRDYSQYSIKSCLKVLEDMTDPAYGLQYNQSDLTGASNRIIELMKERGLKDVIRGSHGHVFTLEGEEPANVLDERKGRPIVCHIDSELFKHIASQAGPNTQLINKHVEWMVLTPGVKKDVKGLPEEEAGLHVGGNVIFIDTKADLGARNPVEFPPVAAHEAQHSQNHGIGLSRLEDELTAHDTQLDTVKHQLKDSKPGTPETKTLKGMEHMCDHRMMTAGYLLELDRKEFAGVYPREEILAGDLLDGNVSTEALRNYSGVDTGNPEMDGELRDASKIALIVRENMEGDKVRREAVEELRKIATSTTGKYEDYTNRQRKNAVSALAYIQPALLETKSTPGYETSQERGRGIGFGRLGRSVREGEKVVYQLPSVDQLMKPRPPRPKKKPEPVIEPDEKILPLSKETAVLIDDVWDLSKQPAGGAAATTPQLERWRQAREVIGGIESRLTSKLGNAEGQPRGFTYNGYVAHRDGTTEVVFQNPDPTMRIPWCYEDTGEPIKHADGSQAHLMLTKIDIYENGRFKESAFRFKREYGEQDWGRNSPKFFTPAPRRY